MSQVEEDIKLLRKYYKENNTFESIKRFKSILKSLIEANNPEALVIGSTIQFENMSDEEFEKNRVDLLNRAVEMDFAPAMIELAEDYYNDKNYSKAFELYEKAAGLNNAYALKEVALALEHGLYGYIKDVEKAEELKNKANDGIIWSVEEGYSSKICDYDNISHEESNEKSE